MDRNYDKKLLNTILHLDPRGLEHMSPEKSRRGNSLGLRKKLTAVDALATIIEGDADEAIVRTLLDNNLMHAINSRDRRGRSPLAVAANLGNENFVRLLLDRQAFIDPANISENHPLSEASKKGHTAIAQLLLDRGALHSLENRLGDTALIEASRGGYEPTVRLLLDRGADHSHSNKRGDTALIEASRGGYEPTVRLLLDRGADYSGSNKGGDTALIEAISKGDEPTIRLLIDRGADSSQLKKPEDVALIQAIREQHELLVCLMLGTSASSRQTGLLGNALVADRDAQCEARNSATESVLYPPRHSGHRPVTRPLCSRGASPDVASAQDETPSASTTTGNGGSPKSVATVLHELEDLISVPFQQDHTLGMDV